MSLSERLDVSNLWHNWVAVIAFFIVGIWTFVTFIIIPSSSVRQSHEINLVPLVDGRAFLRVEVRLQNDGNWSETYADSSYLYIEINNLSPDSSLLKKWDAGGLNFSNLTKRDSLFPSVAYNWFYFNENTALIIKPGLQEVMYFNYLLPKNIKSISIYSFIADKDDKPLRKATYSTHVLNTLNQ